MIPYQPHRPWRRRLIVAGIVAGVLGILVVIGLTVVYPRVGACIDTVNAFMVMEDPMVAIENLAPRAYTNHFRDDRIEFKRYGCKLTGTAVGDGDIDMKRAYEIIKTQSSMNRINIETEMEIPIDDMQTALSMEKETIERSIQYCRKVLGIAKDDTR